MLEKKNAARPLEGETRIFNDLVKQVENNELGIISRTSKTQIIEVRSLF